MDGNGDLRLRTYAEDVWLRKLEAWQAVGGQRQRVSCAYSLSENGEVIVAVGEYDHSRELTIDPVISFKAWFCRGPVKKELCRQLV